MKLGVLLLETEAEASSQRFCEGMDLLIRYDTWGDQGSERLAKPVLMDSQLAPPACQAAREAFAAQDMSPFRKQCCAAHASAIRAMALARMGRIREARKWRTAAQEVKISGQELMDSGVDFTDHWHEWLYLKRLLEQADDNLSMERRLA